MPKWSEVTPAQVDVSYARHQLTVEDVGHLETSNYTAIYETSEAVLDYIVAAVKTLTSGARLSKVLGTLYLSGLRDGWYIRDEQVAASMLESLVLEEEIAQLRREIGGGTSSEERV